MKLYVLSPQLKVIIDCFFQGQLSYHPNNVSEVIHVCQIHDNLPFEVMESVIMFFYIQLLVQWENVCAITLIVGNE